MAFQEKKISFTIDTWSSSVKNGASDYMGVVAHFIDEDWKPKTLLIGFESLEQRHTTPYFLSDKGSNIALMMDLVEEETASTIRFNKNSNIYEMDILYSGDIGSDLSQNLLVKLYRGICEIRASRIFTREYNRALQQFDAYNATCRNADTREIIRRYELSAAEKKCLVMMLSILKPSSCT
ncbi:hypothetical protein A0J61_11741 [Choanephora cucurbitarum]|uniref:Uncharacterized protein n=1 Tax=Choanephora cucurbitarum TaxID=101091 RepID=A0A1C7MTP5_9FUNG|nr:hypothetical protein A0J61_11741 [Choanephora cucurbitarum]